MTVSTKSSRAKWVICAMACYLIVGCAASPQKRVARGLNDLGVEKPMAKCVAEQMDERLDKSQMKAVAESLEGTKEVRRRPPTLLALPPLEVLRVLERLEDRQIGEAALRAGTACTLVHR